MSASRLGKNWADVDEDEEEEGDQSPTAKAKAARFETAPDAEGVKTVIEYKERDGKTYKVTKRVKMTTVTKWSNIDITARKSMEKFGKPKTADPVQEASHIKRVEDEVVIEVARRQVQISQTDNAEDKFYEEALKTCENLFKEKKVWTDVNREKQVDREPEPAKPDPAKPADAAAAPADGAKPADGQPGRYVPPSLRQGKGAGKGDLQQQQEASLRITNLSEDVREGDLQDLFGTCGRLQRVYLAKDPNTQLSKGFAFVTYYDRAHAQKAIDTLHRHPYDNLILQVQWARPRGP